MKVLGICGLAGSGKDTAANYVAKDYGYIQIALADPLKRFAHKVFGFSEEQLWGASKHRNAHSAPDWDVVDNAFKHNYRAWLKEVTCGEASTTHEADLLDWYYEFKSLALKNESTSPRIVLQSLGTGWGRERYFENIWIDYALNVVTPKVTQHAYIYSKSAGPVKQSAPPGVILSDVRFRNEIEQLAKRGGKIIKLTRKSLDDAGEPGITNHKSEAEQKSMEPELFSMILSNNGTIPDLYRDLDVFMNCA